MKNSKSETHRIGFRGEDMEKAKALCEHYLLSMPELCRYLIRLEHRRTFDKAATDAGVKKA